jgi:hypothetical protein
VHAATFFPQSARSTRTFSKGTICYASAPHLGSKATMKIFLGGIRPIQGLP